MIGENGEIPGERTGGEVDYKSVHAANKAADHHPPDQRRAKSNLGKVLEMYKKYFRKMRHEVEQRFPTKRRKKKILTISQTSIIILVVQPNNLILDKTLQTMRVVKC